MGCEQPYHNPAGLKFVTRVEYLGGSPMYANALAGESIILNIPNGAGPGTLFLGTHDTYASWTVRDTKNLVRETQRAYTGAASWEQLFVEDGCTVSVTLLDRDSVNSFNDDGVAQRGVFPSPRIFAEWFPSGTSVPSFTRLSLMTGPLGTANPYPIPTGINITPILTPPGLCRFISVQANNPTAANIRNITPATNVLYEAIPATTFFTRAIPAWCIVEIVLAVGDDVAVCWNRYPMIGS